MRIGNGAYAQFQLDVYGETINSVYVSRKHGLPARQDAWDQLRVLVDFVEQNWQRPDEGIWEIRGSQQLQFTYSKLMAWVALDRAVRLIEEFDVGAGQRLATRLQRWRAVREEIRDDILTNGFNPRVGAFTQSYGSDHLDASVLLMPHMGFLPADDPRIRSTVAAIERHLTSDGFVFRYATETGVDGLAGQEAPFLFCSFWLADNYVMAGRFQEAEALLERLLSLPNDLGLLAEEYHPKLGRQLGNFPQAFSHVGLINTAFLLEATRAASGQRRPGTVAA